jgi:ABC-type transport system substrate-binding protein
MWAAVRPGSARRALPLAAGALVVLAACAPAAPTSGQRSQPSAGAAPGVKKTIVFGAIAPINAFSLAEVGSGSAGRALTELWLQGLVTSGMKSQAPEPRLAAEMPSLDRGTMRVDPDGTETVTWKIRTDVKWADGTPFTAQDFLFGYHVATDENSPFPSGTLGRELSSMTAPDDYTLVMVWKRPYYLADAIGSPVAGLQPLPRHILAEEFAANNVERFKNLPYWTSEFFHVGPFRPSQITPGVEIVLEAVPHYFLGKPKVDSIVIKLFQDANVVYTALLSKQIDMTQYIESEQGFELKEQWERTGEGTVYSGVRTSAGIFFQFAPELQAEPAILERPVRQALFYALDRQSWLDAVMGTKTNLLATGLLPYTHQLSSYTKDSIAGRYRYDPQLSSQMLADAGWVRGADGFVTNTSDGRRFKMLVWTGQNEKEAAILADMWKAVGLDTSIYITTPARREDREYTSSFPNMELTNRGYGDTILTRMECAETTIAPSFRGANRGHYCSGDVMEPLLGQYRSSLRMDEQGRYIKQIADFAAEDLPVIQTYFQPFLAHVVKGVTALKDDFDGALEAGGRYGSYYRNSHLWDKN